MSKSRDRRQQNRPQGTPKGSTGSASKPQEKPQRNIYGNRLPLYKSVQDVFIKVEPFDSRVGNPSLLYDKFIDVWHWSGNNPLNGIDKEVKTGRNGSNQESVIKLFLEGFLPLHQWAGELKDDLEDYLQRRRELVEKLGGRTIRLRTEWRFMSGTGAHHPLESGFVWHHTLGVPYLPASGVKGVIRASITPLRPGEDASPEEIRSYFEKVMKVEELFGYESIEKEDDLLNKLSDDERQRYNRSPREGSLIVFDAIPTALPRLELDILNVHYPDYYGQHEPPADWQSPNPVYFLTVGPDCEFEFALAPIARNGDGRTDKEKGKRLLEEGEKILMEALNSLGAGAKTSIGYGRFRRSTQEGAQETASAATKAVASAPEGTPSPTTTTTAAPSEQDLRFEELQRQIGALRPGDIGKADAAVNSIANADLSPAQRSELARQLDAKLFPPGSDKKRKERQDKGWYKKLQNLIEKGEAE